MRNESRARVRLGLVFLLAACLSLVGGVSAAQDAGGSIIGQVTDESGAILPGVTVTATSPALQVPSVIAVSNDRGEYRLAPLPIGLYTVVYELSGFSTSRREDIRLTVGFTARLDVTMAVGVLTETVTVSGASPVVDVTSTAVSSQFTRESLELIPGSRNGVIGVLAQAPGVRTNLDVGGSTQNSQPGSRTFGMAAEAWYTLEGQPVTDMKGIGGAGVYFDYSIVDEARVQSLGADAQFPTRGAQLQMIAKSGGNDFHGSYNASYTTKSFQGNNIDAPLIAIGLGDGNPLQYRDDYSADLGGKLVENKLWFYGAARRRGQQTQTLGAYLADGSASYNTSMVYYLTEKLSYQMNPANRFVGFLTYTHIYRDPGATQFVHEESRVEQWTRIPTMKFEWQAVKGNLVMNLQHGSWGTDNSNKDNSNGKPATLDLATQLTTGMNFGAVGHYQVSKNHRFNQNGSISWYKSNWFFGNHNLKAGFDNNYYKTTRSQLRIVATGNYHMVYRNGVPEEVRVKNGPTYDLQNVHNTALYLQDSWTVGRRVTLNLGVRYMRDNGFVNPSCREAADFPGTLFAPARCFDKTQLAIYNSLAPRLRSSWDVTGDGRTVIKGGWGRFPHLRYADPEVLRTDPNRVNIARYRWRDLNGNRLWEPTETNLDPNGPDFISASLDADAIPNPDEKQPVSDEFSVTFERELPGNLAVRVTGVYSRYTNILRLQQNFRPYEVWNIPITRPDPGNDGVVNTADDPGAAITFYEYPVALRPQTFAQKMMVNDPNADQKYKSLDLGVYKRFTNGWQFSASYTTTKKHVPFHAGLTPGSFDSQVEVGSFDPNAEINQLDNTVEWTGKLSGAYQFPYGFMVSGSFESRQGSPYARQVLFTGGQTITSIVLNTEPIGTRRLPTTNLTDMRVEKRFKIGRSEVAARMNIYNLLNQNTTTALNMRASATFERPTAILPPRLMEIGASLTF